MKRILYVEDDDDSAYMLTRRLIKEGFDVCIASTGEEGVAAAESAAPDLVLMDVNLPGIDGYEALRRIRDLPNLSKVPVIIVSANAMRSDSVKAEEAGADGFESKPVRFASLKEKIEILLR